MLAALTASACQTLKRISNDIRWPGVAASGKKPMSPHIWCGQSPQHWPGRTAVGMIAWCQMLREYPPDANAAAEQALRDALDAAWADYQQAGSADKPEAWRRYAQELRRFRDLVLSRG